MSLSQAVLSLFSRFWWKLLKLHNIPFLLCVQLIVRHSVVLLSLRSGMRIVFVEACLSPLCADATCLQTGTHFFWPRILTAFSHLGVALIFWMEEFWTPPRGEPDARSMFGGAHAAMSEHSQDSRGNLALVHEDVCDGYERNCGGPLESGRKSE